MKPRTPSRSFSSGKFRWRWRRTHRPSGVDQKRRDARGLGAHHRRDQRAFLARRQEEDINALRDQAVHIGDLLRGRSAGIGKHQIPAAGGGRVLEALRLGDPPGIVAFGLGEADLVAVLLFQGRQALRHRQARRQRQRHRSGSKQNASFHVFLPGARQTRVRGRQAQLRYIVFFRRYPSKPCFPSSPPRPDCPQPEWNPCTSSPLARLQ